LLLLELVCIVLFATSVASAAQLQERSPAAEQPQNKVARGFGDARRRNEPFRKAKQCRMKTTTMTVITTIVPTSSCPNTWSIEPVSHSPMKDSSVPVQSPSSLSAKLPSSSAGGITAENTDRIIVVSAPVSSSVPVSAPSSSVVSSSAVTSTPSSSIISSAPPSSIPLCYQASVLSVVSLFSAKRMEKHSVPITFTPASRKLLPSPCNLPSLRQLLRPLIWRQCISQSLHFVKGLS